MLFKLLDSLCNLLDTLIYLDKLGELLSADGDELGRGGDGTFTHLNVDRQILGGGLLAGLSALKLVRLLHRTICTHILILMDILLVDFANFICYIE